jgi:hypothetical protein
MGMRTDRRIGELATNSERTRSLEFEMKLREKVGMIDEYEVERT